MARSPQRKDGQRRREALLDAALTVFTEKGLMRAGIEDVRVAAGASPSSVYHYFSDLGDLTLALLVRTFEGLFGRLTEEVLTTTTARDAVCALVAAQLGWVFEEPAQARFMYQAMSLDLGDDITAPLMQKKAEQMAALAAHFGQFMARGELPLLEPLQFDVVVLGVTHEACRRWLLGAPLDPHWMAAALPELAWQSLHQARPPSGAQD